MRIFLLSLLLWPSGILPAQTLSAMSAHPSLETGGGATASHAATPGSLILIGFLGGNIKGSDLLRKEGQLAQQLQQENPRTVRSAMFANGDGRRALKTVLQMLGDKDGRLTEQQKQSARIVIFGHSWGASETIHLADRLNALKIPVLLTVQVDSVQKLGQNDRRIPPNVAEAANFYQSEGFLRGCSSIVAADPAQTKILGNYQSSYKDNPVSVAGFPWYARLFMRTHIEIENDPAVWSRVEALIQSKIRAN
jgi:hypothetical protein